MRMRSPATPRPSHSMRTNAVSWPWPVDCDTQLTCRTPDASKRAYAWSLGATPAALRALAPGRKALPVGEPQCLVHDGLELAAVVGRSVRGLVGHRLRRNEILPPQRDRVETVLGHGAIDEALDHAGDVGPPGATVRRDRNGARIGTARVRVHRRDPVHAAHGDGDVARADLRAERRGEGAEIGAVFEAQREEGAVAG